MTLWKTFPASTWIATDDAVIPVGLGLKPHGLAYAVDDSKFLNGTVDAQFEIVDELFSVGVVYRANLAWTFMACIFSNYDVRGNALVRDRLASRVVYVRNGMFHVLKTSTMETSVSKGHADIALEINGAAIKAKFRTEGYSADIDGSFPHVPFAGSAGIVSLHRGGFRCLSLTSSVDKMVEKISMKNRPKVFLCHASQDKDRVRQFARELVLRGIEYWLDEEQIGPGDPVAGSISEGLEACTHILPFLSENLKKTNWARLEYNSILNLYVTNKSKKVIPVYSNSISVDNIPILMADLRRIDIEDANQIDQLILAIEGK